MKNEIILRWKKITPLVIYIYIYIFTIICMLTGKHGDLPHRNRAIRVGLEQTPHPIPLGGTLVSLLLPHKPHLTGTKLCMDFHDHSGAYLRRALALQTGVPVAARVEGRHAGEAAERRQASGARHLRLHG